MTHTVTYHGQTWTRNDRRPFTHVGMVRWSDGEITPAKWSTSQAEAGRNVLTRHQLANGARVVAVVEVTR